MRTANREEYGETQNSRSHGQRPVVFEIESRASIWFQLSHSRRQGNSASRQQRQDHKKFLIYTSSGWRRSPQGRVEQRYGEDIAGSWCYMWRVVYHCLLLLRLTLGVGTWHFSFLIIRSCSCYGRCSASEIRFPSDKTFSSYLHLKSYYVL